MRFGAQRQRHLWLCVALVTALSSAPLFAADYSWTGTGGTSWSTSGNWSPSGPPPNNGTASLIFTSTGTCSGNPNNNISGTLTVAKLDFANGLPALSLTGNPLAFAVTNSGVYQDSASAVTINNAISWSGATTLSLNTPGAGGLVLNGNLSTTATAGTVKKIGGGSLTLNGSNGLAGMMNVDGGLLAVAGTGALSAKNLNVGYSLPGSMDIADSAVVNVTGELDLNSQIARGDASQLTIRNGTLGVSGPMVVGRGRMSTGPATTSAAVYQTGGAATVQGLLTVGGGGTATSLYDINGGVTSATAGLVVGGAGNGSLFVHGSGTVKVSGGQGLVIGQDATLATGGSVQLAGGILSVTGDMTLGGTGGGAGILNRTGGSLSVSNNLGIGGYATLILDKTIVPVSTSFGGTLTHSNNGTLTVIPVVGDLAGGESVSFGVAAASLLSFGSTNIIAPWAVRTMSGADTRGDYLTVVPSGSGCMLATATYTAADFTSTTNTSVVSVSNTQSISGDQSAYALKNSGSLTIGTSNTLSLAGGGIILNGGTVTGGTIDCSSSPAMIYAGGTTVGTIRSAIKGTAGFVKFGPSTLILTGSNSSALTGPLAVGAGTLNVQFPYALGGSSITVASGATIELQGGTQVKSASQSITLNGSGVGGAGSLRNVAGNNRLDGQITLGSDAQINVVADALTLSGALAGNFVLTKTGSGSLILNDNNSAFSGSMTVTAGTLATQLGSALGQAGASAVTVQSGAALTLAGGLTIPNIALSLNGIGGGSGSLVSLQGDNFVYGPVTLSGDSLISVNSDSLSLKSIISGGYGLTKAGSGTLVLTTTANSFTGALNVLDGNLSVDNLSTSSSGSELGLSNAPVLLGSDSKIATFLYTGPSATTSRAFTLGGGGAAVFSTTSNLTLSGPIGGGGSLTKLGNATLTLSVTNNYTGTTTVSAGTLAISPSGAINATSGIAIGQGATLQVSGSGGQLPDAGNVTINGGNLNVSTSGSGEVAGALVLNRGQNNISVSRSSGTTGTPALRFASGTTTYSTGVTVNFSADANSQIQFAGNPPGPDNNIIGGYAFFGGSDFATRTTSAPYTLSAWAYSPSATGDLAGISSSATLNVKAGTTQTALGSSREYNSLKLSDSAALVTTSTITLDSGGLILGNSSSISGGVLRGSPGGELVVNTPSGTNQSTITSTIANNGSATALVKTGSATLYLSNSANTYTGDTHVNAGTLKMLALTNSANIYVSGGAVFQANYIDVDTLSVDPGGTIILGNPSGSAGAGAFIDPGSSTGSPLLDGCLDTPASISAASIPQPVSGIAIPTSVSAASTPEPGSIVLLVTGVAVLLAWRVASRRTRCGTLLVEGRGTGAAKSSPGSVLRPRPSTRAALPFWSSFGCGRRPR